MRKPSSQIIELVEALPVMDNSDPNGEVSYVLTGSQKDEIIRLCKVVDRRDQQYRKGQKPKPAAAKKKARR